MDKVEIAIIASILGVFALIGILMVCLQPSPPDDGQAYIYVPAQKARWVPVDAYTSGTEVEL